MSGICTMCKRPATPEGGRRFADGTVACRTCDETYPTACTCSAYMRPQAYDPLCPIDGDATLVTLLEVELQLLDEGLLTASALAGESIDEASVGPVYEALAVELLARAAFLRGGRLQAVLTDVVPAAEFQAAMYAADQLAAIDDRLLRWAV